MAESPKAPRDWHRLFGLLLTDLFTGSPFVVELERDLSVQLSGWMLMEAACTVAAVTPGGSAS